MYKNLFVILYSSILFLLIGCAKNLSNKDIVERYATYYNGMEKEKITTILSDDFIIKYQKDFVEVSGKDKFMEVLDWGKIMNAKIEMISFFESDTKITVFEKYINDRDRLLQIPSIELKATYFIENSRITSISLDTLDTGRKKIDNLRRDKLDGFTNWCSKNRTSIDFDYNKKGAIELHKALEEYVKQNIK